MNDKAKRALIHIAGIELEVFQLPSGEYVMSQSQVAEAIKVHPFSVSRFIKEQRKNQGYKSHKNKDVNSSNPYAKRVIEITKTLSINDSSGRGGNNNPINIIPINLASEFWATQAFKGNIKAQSLAYACIQEALERRCDTAFQQVKAEEEYEDIAINNRLSWQESRRFLLDAHSSFTNSCGYWGFDAAKAHDEITLAVCGKTARDLRELDVIEGNPKVGLNHIADRETLVRIAKVKLEFSRYRTGTVKQRVKRALESINN